MTKDYFGWIILSIAILGAALIYACATRYTYMPSNTLPYVLDRWTGKTHYVGDSN
jgi:hypothetical protein